MLAHSGGAKRAAASIWRPLLVKVASAPRVGGTAGSHLSIFVVLGERSGSAKRHYNAREISSLFRDVKNAYSSSEAASLYSTPPGAAVGMPEGLLLPLRVGK